MSNVFALPIPVSQQSRVNATGTKKRKRTATAANGRQSHQAGESKTHDGEEDDNKAWNTATHSPEERVQRQLAGSHPKKPLPPSPFPHKDTILPRPSRDVDASDKSTTAQTLRVRHIAAMTAVLHKCLREEDWPRARRALGLLLRTEIHGQPLDLRVSDYWGIGAEILFCHQPDRGKTWSRSGFADAKGYYEKLIVRFPYRRGSPDSINAIDFYLALFSLWIFVAQAETETAKSGGDGSLSDATLARELDEAAMIKARIDKCMGTAPYADNVYFKQLRSDVDLWHANLATDHPFIAGEAAVNDLSAAAWQLNL